jgi:Uma2 family endonuclease
MVMTAQQLADLMPDATQLESNEPQMESTLHYAQLALLVACLEWLWRDRADFFIGANLTIFYSRAQLKNREFSGPDFFLVKQTRQDPRRSWVVWEEGGQYPDLIIELLSDSTARTDRTKKKDLYQNRFRTPEYFWFSPETMEFAGFRLINQQYEPILATPMGHLWSEVLGLFLGICDGQLRYFLPSGELVPTPQEAAQQAQIEAQQAQIEAQQAQAEVQQAQIEAQQAAERAARLAQRLRELGIDPET